MCEKGFLSKKYIFVLLSLFCMFTLLSFDIVIAADEPPSASQVTGGTQSTTQPPSASQVTGGTNLGGAPGTGGSGTTQDPQATGGTQSTQSASTGHIAGDFLIKTIAGFIKVGIIMLPVIGFYMIGMGIVRFMQGNNGPSQGKGAAGKIILGTCFSAGSIFVKFLINILASSGFKSVGAILKYL